MGNNNFIKEDIIRRYTLFNQLFTEYQVNLRRNNEYIKYEAFKDLKVIFELYAQIYHLRGYNYNDISLKDLKKLTKEFDCHREKELYEFLAKRLIKEGNDEKAKEVLCYHNQLEVLCLWDKILHGKSLYINIPKILLKTSSYNLLSLLTTCLLYVLLATLIYSPAPNEWMSILKIAPVNLSTHNYFNSFLNTLSHIFDLDTKMSVQPINWRGVLLLVAGKSFFIVVILNYIVKEIMNKIKFS